MKEEGKSGDTAIVNYVRNYVNVKYEQAKKVAMTEQFEFMMSDQQNKEESEKVRAAFSDNKSF